MEKSSVRWWDLPSAFFLFTLILLASWRLEATNWVDDLNRVRNVAVLGLAVGLALGQSVFRKRPIFLLSIAYMPVFFVWQWLGAIDFSYDETYLGDKLMILFGRLWVSLGEYLGGKPVNDPLFFIALLSIPYWLIGFFSGYQMTRHARVAATILPGAILMIFIHLNHYTQTDYTWLFAIYLFMALLLLSRQKFLTDKARWMRERVLISSESNLDMSNSAIIIAAGLVVLAWAIPYTLPANVLAKERWNTLYKSWFPDDGQDVFSYITQERQAAPVETIQTELALGSQTPQSALVEFLVYAPAASREIPRLYWRGYIYDHYENGKWEITDLQRLPFAPADGEFDIPTWTRRRNLTFTFDVYKAGQTILYTPTQPLWTNRTSTILHQKVLEQEASLLDVMVLQASPSLKIGDIYRVTAVLANPTVSELREAGDEYPNWVMDRYLQLPDGFSPRIQTLAAEITSDHDTPYDKAAAVTEYLRNEIEYASFMSFPVESMDRLEYFLFEGKQGFCNYYASAEVLMLRSVGIPARLAVGFAQGESDLQNTLYTVRERDFHAWPEVYFPGYGWVEFEPTGNQEPLERQLERVENATPTPNPSTNPAIPQLLEEKDVTTPEIEVDQAKLSDRTELLLKISLSAGTALLLAFLLIFIKRRYAPTLQATTVFKKVIERGGWSVPSWLNIWLVWSAALPIERHFHSINVSLRWMGKPQPVYMTAAERAAILQKLVPTAAEAIDILLREHQSHLFTPNGGNQSLTRKAAWHIMVHTITMRLKIIILGYNMET